MSDLPELYVLNTLRRSRFTRINFHMSPPKNISSSSLTQHYTWRGFIFQSSGLLQCSVWHHDQCCLFLGISVTNTEPESGTGTGKPSLGGGWAVPKRWDFSKDKYSLRLNLQSLLVLLYSIHFTGLMLIFWRTIHKNWTQ